MANPFLTDPADKGRFGPVPDFSRNETSTAADKRKPNVAPVDLFDGNQAAPSSDSPIAGPLYKNGGATPSDFLLAPFPVINTKGDTSGDGTEIYEISPYSFGDDFDATAPARIRKAKEWDFDPDMDGNL